MVAAAYLRQPALLHWRVPDGAYQESLSDDHNLMGKFHIVSVDEHEPYENSTYVYGSTLREVLEHVHHDWPDMSRDFSSSVELAVREELVSPELGAEIFTFFEQMSESYTYLTDTVGEPVGQSPRAGNQLLPRSESVR